MDVSKPVVPGTTENEVQTALIAGKALGKAIENPHKESQAYAIVPPGHALQYLNRPHSPFRKQGTVKFNDAPSFIEYWGEEHGNDSRIYASIEPAQFLAVFNDHTTEFEDPDDSNKEGHPNAGWKDYRAIYKLRHSREWLAWAEHDRKPFSGNEAFAIWLEDNAIDLVAPEPATMMDVALNLRVHQEQGFSNAVRLQDGNIRLNYSNVVNGQATANDGTDVQIPEVFTLSIPVFEGLTAPKYSLQARFRYRLNSGSLTIRYELVRAHKVIEKAFTDLVELIAKETGATALFGTPE